MPAKEAKRKQAVLMVRGRVVIVGTPKGWTDEQRTAVEAVVRNAVRLLEDAALLQTYERYGSSHMLATLAFEEVGKVALRCWGDGCDLRAVDRRWSYHVRKQAAAACLMMAAVVVDRVEFIRTQGGKEAEEPGHPEHEAFVATIAEVMHGDESSKLLKHIALNVIERLKHAAVYLDEANVAQGFTPTEFRRFDCERTISEAQGALRSLRENKIIHVAKAIYLTDPLHSHRRRKASQERREQ